MSNFRPQARQNSGDNVFKGISVGRRRLPCSSPSSPAMTSLPTAGEPSSKMPGSSPPGSAVPIVRRSWSAE